MRPRCWPRAPRHAELGTSLGLRRRAALGGLRLRSLAVLLGRRRAAGRHGGLSAGRDRRADRAGGARGGRQLAHARRRSRSPTGPRPGGACRSRWTTTGSSCWSCAAASRHRWRRTSAPRRPRRPSSRSAATRARSRSACSTSPSRCGCSPRASGTRRACRTSARQAPITCSASSSWSSASRAAREPSLSADRAIHVLAVIAAARRAAGVGRFVDVSEEEGRDVTGDAPLRLGIVGTGAIALRGLLPHLTQDDVQERVQVAAVCDPVPGRADAVAERFGVPQAFTRPRDAARPGRRGRRLHRIADRSAPRPGPARAGGRRARARQQDALDHGRGGRRPDRARAGARPRPRRLAGRGAAPAAPPHPRADRRRRDRPARLRRLRLRLRRLPRERRAGAARRARATRRSTRPGTSASPAAARCTT